MRGLVTIENIRPAGFEYPTGLNFTSDGMPSSTVDYLVVAAAGGTVTTSPGYTIHTFTGDGTFTTNSTFGNTSYSIN